MRRKTKKMLSIDFGSKNIKIAKGIFKKGKLNIERNYLLDLPEHLYEDGYIKNKDTLIHMFDSFLRFNNIKTKNTIAVINSLDILTRSITIPNVSSDEISGILKYKIADYIPINPKKYIVQYIEKGIIVKNGNTMIELFIIAMPKVIVDQHFNFLKSVGLKPKVLDFQINAINKLLSFSDNLKNNLNIKNKIIASIDIGFFETNLGILNNKNIEISRTIPLGLKNIQKEIKKNEDISGFLAELFENIKMVFRYYNSQEENEKIELIILQGVLAEKNSIIVKFEKSLNIETININSLTGIENYDLHVYSNAIGGLIRGDDA